MDDINIAAVLPHYPVVTFGGQTMVVIIIRHADAAAVRLGARLHYPQK